MGQQQLLLVILVTIIVGIATVVAINTFGSAADNAARDAVRQDMLQVAASAQAYYMKPTMLDGGGKDFSKITFKDITLKGDFGTNADDTENDLEVSNSNGTYKISGRQEDQFTLTGVTSNSETQADDSESNTFTATITQDNLEFADN